MFTITQATTPATTLAHATPVPELPPYEEEELDDLFDRLERGEDDEKEDR